MKESRAREILDGMKGKVFSHKDFGEDETILSYRLDVVKDSVAIKTNLRDHYHPLSRLQQGLADYAEVKESEDDTERVEELAIEPETEAEEIVEVKNNNPAMTTKTGGKVNVSDTPKTFTDLKEILMDNILLLQQGKIPVETAKQIANHVQGIVNITKIEFQYYKEVKK